MPGHRLVAEAGGEALEKGLGERDLGQQDERLPPPPKRLGDRFEIDLGLAGPGHPVEQEGREGRGPDRLDEDVRRRALGQLQLGRIVIRVGEREGVVDRDFDRLDRARLDEAPDHPVRDPRRDRQLAHQPLPLADPLQRLGARGGQPFGDEAGQAIFGDRPPALQGAGRSQGHAQHRGERGEVVIGGPLDQPPERLGERRQVVGGDERPEAIVADRLGFEPVLLPDHAGQLPRAERSEHDRARADLHALRHAIVERPDRGIEQEDSAAVHPRLDRVAGSETQPAGCRHAVMAFLSRSSRERRGPPRSGGR